MDINAKRKGRMDFKSIIGVLFTSFTCISFNTNAAIISADWQTAGDNLITVDTGTGLRWLDLTETNATPFSTISSQLEQGGLFEGFRYATVAEVINLWSKFGVDLSTGSDTSIDGPLDPGIETASLFLGNNGPEVVLSGSGGNVLPYLILGLAAPIDNVWTSVPRLGAAYRSDPIRNFYEIDGEIFIEQPMLDFSDAAYGSYLVTTVPAPPAVWLFLSGFIGLLGISNRSSSQNT